MTTAADPAQTTRPLQLGHPVRSFVLALVLVAVVLVGLRVTGAAYPNLSSSRTSQTSFGSREIVALELRNDSALAVRIEQVTWPTSRTRSAELGLAPPDYLEPDGQLDLADIPPLQPFTLGANEARWILLSVEPECLAQLGVPAVRVRTPLGLHRTVEIHGPLAQDLHGGC